MTMERLLELPPFLFDLFCFFLKITGGEPCELCFQVSQDAGQDLTQPGMLIKGFLDLFLFFYAQLIVVAGKDAFHPGGLDMRSKQDLPVMLHIQNGRLG